MKKRVLARAAALCTAAALLLGGCSLGLPRENEARPDSGDPEEAVREGEGPVLYRAGSGAREIVIRDISKNDYVGYAAEIRDPSMVKLALCEAFGQEGQKLPELAQHYGALAAINAGGFGDTDGQGNGGAVVGLVIENGEWIQGPEDPARCCLAGFTQDNRLVTGYYSSSEIRAMNLRDACEFAPPLVVGGEPYDLSAYGSNYHPRTALAQRADGSVLFVVIDGRSSASAGVTIRQLRQIVLDEGAVTAVNMDGGSSSVLYLKGVGVINHPSGSDSDGMRYLPNAWIVTD